MPKRPHWLKPLGTRDEKLRAAKGLMHRADGWYKTFDGETRYICKPCPLADALAVMDARIEAIRAKRAGRETVQHVVTPGTLTLKQTGDAYQAWLWQRLTTGLPRKLSRRTYDDAIATVGDFIEVAGPDKPADATGPADFSAYTRKHLAGRAASTIRRRVIYLEAFANWAAPGSRKAGLLVRPWQFGADFRKPSDDEISTSAADSDKAYSPEQLRKSFLAVRKNKLFRAAGWLALCGAFAPKDLALIPESLVDLEGGFIRYARGKTGVGRLCWLPACARIAVRDYLAERVEAKEESAKLLLFRSIRGLAMYREADGQEPGSRYDAMGSGWHKLTSLPMSGLRSTFATLADDWTDQRAVDVVMGQKSGTHSRSVRNKHYAKRFSSERAQRLVSAVVSLAFGRKIRDPSPQLSSPAVPAASPGAAGARPPRQPDRSATAASAPMENSRRKRSVPRP